MSLSPDRQSVLDFKRTTPAKKKQIPVINIENKS